MPASKIQLAARLNAVVFGPVARIAATNEARRRNSNGQLELQDRLIEADLPKHISVAVTHRNQIVGMCATQLTQLTSNLCHDMQIGIVIADGNYVDSIPVRVMYSGFDKAQYYKALQRVAGAPALKFYNFQFDPTNDTYKFVCVV